MLDSSIKENFKKSVCHTAISTAEYFVVTLLTNEVTKYKENSKDIFQFMAIDFVYNTIDNYSNNKIKVPLFDDKINNDIVNEVVAVYILKNIYDLAIDKRSFAGSFVSNTMAFGGLGIVQKLLSFL